MVYSDIPHLGDAWVQVLSMLGSEHKDHSDVLPRALSLAQEGWGNVEGKSYTAMW